MLKMKRALALSALLANILIVYLIWWSGSKMLFAIGASGMFIAFGRLSGLMLEVSFMFMLVLIARIPWIEQLWGHDKLNKFHRWVGFTTLIGLITHPLFLAIGYSAGRDISILGQLLDFTTHWDDVAAAAGGVVLLILVILISTPFVRKHLAYESWHITHLFTYAAILLAFEHQTAFGDFAGRPAAIAYWYAFNYSVFALLVWYRFLRPIYYSYKHNLIVSKIVKETPLVSSIYITGKKLNEFKFQAGQFANLFFLQKGLVSPHPLSFSCAPNGEYLRFSARASGDFTSKIDMLKIGTKVIIDGPLGTFTEKFSERSKYLLIAGGIGITPIYSLAESLAKKKSDVIIFYASKNIEEICFLKEIEQLPFICNCVLSNQGDKCAIPHENGRIDMEKIKRLAPDYNDREIYVCGPKTMILSLKEQLKTAKYNLKHLHYELFAF
ncbi:MAG: ferric reductase-like transmembrane domain-containing protein [Patescibacteria group bacterium]